MNEPSHGPSDLGSGRSSSSPDAPPSRAPRRRRRRRRKRGPGEPRTIGRSSKCDIVLKRGKVSRRHCKVIPTDDGYWLRDLDSQNGTWIEGERVDRVKITTGDRFAVGNVLLELHADGSLTEVVHYTGALRHLNEEREAARREALEGPDDDADERDEDPSHPASESSNVVESDDDRWSVATAETFVALPPTHVDELPTRDEAESHALFDCIE